MLFDRKLDKLLSRTLYRIRVAVHVILKVRKKDAMNDALFAPLHTCIKLERETGISNKTLSRIKAESEKVVLAPRKPQSDGMKPGDFDKCEYNKLQNHTQTRQRTNNNNNNSNNNNNKDL